MPLTEIRIPVPREGIYVLTVAGQAPLAYLHLNAGQAIVIRAEGGALLERAEWVETANYDEPVIVAAPAAAVPEPPSPGAA